MRIEVNVPEYEPAHGLSITWDDGYAIEARVEGGSVVLRANEAGLVALARHLLTLAQQPAGHHLHLDDSNSLEEGSCELILEKM